MKLAILFWFYKEPKLCENRLQLLHKYNPAAEIYGLYGGDPDQATAFQRSLQRYLDDFYSFDQEKPGEWKWRNGDLLIAQWYRDRGCLLEWDTIFIAQWDMLLFGRLHDLFHALKPGQLLLSGWRPLREVESWWWHTRPGSSQREEFDRFLAFVRAGYGFAGAPSCCLFVIVCLPRAFLDRYAAIPQPELGFLEYKIPVYAEIFGFSICHDHPYQPWWRESSGKRPRSSTLSARKKSVPLRAIVANLWVPGGSRIFHPVRVPYPIDTRHLVSAVTRELVDELIKPFWWTLCRNLSRRLHP